METATIIVASLYEALQSSNSQNALTMIYFPQINYHSMMSDQIGNIGYVYCQNIASKYFCGTYSFTCFLLFPFSYHNGRPIQLCWRPNGHSLLPLSFLAGIFCRLLSEVAGPTSSNFATSSTVSQIYNTVRTQKFEGPSHQKFR